MVAMAHPTSHRLPLPTQKKGKCSNTMAHWGCMCKCNIIISKMFIGGLNWETTDGKIVYSYNLHHIVLSIEFSIKIFISIIKTQIIVIENLRQYFSQFGEVLDCVVMRDPATQRSRGFGFLTMKENSAIDKIVSQDHHNLDGKRVSTRNPYKPAIAHVDWRCLLRLTPRERFPVMNRTRRRRSLLVAFLPRSMKKSSESSLRSLARSWMLLSWWSVIQEDLEALVLWHLKTARAWRKPWRIPICPSRTRL